MANIAAKSDEIIAGGRNALRNQRLPPIGVKSSALRKAHFWGKMRNAALAVGAVLIGASVIGVIINGLGFGGVMLTGLAGAAAAYVLLRYPNMPMPTMETLRTTDLRTLAGKTEIWLEAQRPMLPAPAVNVNRRDRHKARSAFPAIGDAQ